MDALSNAIDIRLTSPLLVFLAPALLLVLLLGIRKKRGELGVATFAGTEGTGIARARFAEWIKVLWLIVLILLTAFVWMGPTQERSFSDKNSDASQDLLSTVVIVFDVSSSMMGYHLDANRTNFEVGRDALAYFLSTQKNMQAGIVFFSDGHFAFTRPHSDLNSIVTDLVSIRFERSKEIGKNQLAKFSNGTNTAPALEFAGKMVSEMDLERLSATSAIILVSDLQDLPSELRNAFLKLIKEGHRVYVVAANATPANIKTFRTEVNSPKFKIFDVSSTKDLKDAYLSISNIERERISERFTRTYKKEEPLRWPAVTLFWGITLFFVISEVFLRRARKEW